ncbi:DoxX family protein [Tsukamurella paurometabola]|uniref:DoxX family protein n=1 Tax=Tsukamurella paurometabola TaxID=2061 RepID=A0ABS5NFR3_TSUPA|nr:DoxX family protein [Tsukamurella paurometabola]MBS4103141.1 DoxX family protein [Tsukamurella paurometabola]
MTTGFIDTPHWPWLTVALAVVLLGDAAMSLRPPAFIRDCLDGVRFPRDWWWTLIVIKSVAVAGLLAGLEYPGVGFAANAGVIAYFVCAAVSHIRAGFLGSTFWVNCLGMLAFSTGVLILSYI